MGRCACCLIQLLIGCLVGFMASQATFKIWTYAGCRFSKNESGHYKKYRHLDTEKLVLVGVLTTRKYLKTRADAIYKTWGQYLTGRLVFFIGTGDDFNTSLPVVVLKNVSDDAYPPQRKCFEMLRYMSDHHGHDFHWFMRLDDDVYLNTDLLKKFLTSINSSQHEYMGRPGIGMPRERGHLGIDKAYCMGGPGVVLSGSLLRQVAPHLLHCLKDPATSHEDTELGRCIDKVTGMSCTKQKHFKGLFHAHYTEETGAWAVRMKPDDTVKVLSFHPMKNPINQFRLHIIFLTKRIQEERLYKVLLEREKSSITTSGFVKECNPCYVDNGEVWTCIKASYVYSMESAHLKDSTLHRGRNLGLVAIEPALKPFLKNGIHLLSNIWYQRTSVLNGLEHILVTRDVKNHYQLFRTRRQLNSILFRELPPRRY